MPARTLRELAGLSPAPAPLGRSALVVIDAQVTYTQGVMRLEGVEAALAETRTLLDRARARGRPVIHIAHDDGPGSLYDVNGETGRIVELVAAGPDAPVIVKADPSSFERTDLAERLRTQRRRPRARRVLDPHGRQLDRARRVQPGLPPDRRGGGLAAA